MLPPLRDELALYPGPMAANGSPTWTLLDPVRNRFFKIDWPAFEILGRWALADPETIAKTINGETTLDISVEDVDDVAKFLSSNMLMRISNAQGTDHLNKMAQSSKRSWWQWLLHNYLFIRIPLIRPDRFLTRTYQYVTWAFSRWFFIMTVFALILGIFLVIRQWDMFTTTLVDTFTPRGALLYGLVLGLVKAIHELGHAYAAKRYGCRVATMGFAFLVMWPVLYTDTNEAWKLTSRHQRLMIGLAGVVAELSIAAFATLAWAFSPEGSVRDLMFMVAAVTWVSSLLINLSPFMRFDGYFVLMDWLDMPNLHARSFAITRWWIRESLFGLGEAPPEKFSRQGTVLLILFAIATWIYRLVLFLGIAAMVYEFAFKVLGILLFIVEILWFVLLPVWREVQEWWKRRIGIATSFRSLLPLFIVVSIIGATIYPWSDRIFAPAMLKASRHTIIFSTGVGRILEMNAEEGKIVRHGDVLFIIGSPDLSQKLKQLRLRIQSLEHKLASTAFNPRFREQSLVIKKNLEAALSKKKGIEKKLTLLTIKAPFSGRLVDVDPDIGVGQWIGADKPLSGLRNTSAMIVDAYLPEEDVARIKAGDTGLFYAETADQKAIEGHIMAIDGSAISSLADEPLGSLFGGAIKVRESNRTLVSDRALYRVRLGFDSGTQVAHSQLRGTVLLHGRKESLLTRLRNSVMSVLVREMDF